MNNKEKELLKSTIGKRVEDYEYTTTHDDSDLHIKFTDGTDLLISTSYNQADMYFDYIENNNEIKKDDDKIMSKELNIVEAMKMPIGTELIIKYMDGYVRKVALVESNEVGNNNVLLKYLDSKDGESHYVDVHRELVKAKFIPTPKPISFMEAITQNHYNDKTIRCEVDDKVYTYKPVQTKTTEIRAIETRGGISTEEILNGKWYIKEN